MVTNDACSTQIEKQEMLKVDNHGTKRTPTPTTVTENCNNQPQQKSVPLS